ncbi:MAG: hypothetical protein JWM95_2060 [Gemmatimonadetes bacterium]|nr:hypothetical protein [Gemmatimonadota bacterium]
MRNFIRLSVSTLALASLAACSRSSDTPTISADLKQDLAAVGGGDVQLASATSKRLDIVSASERTNAPVATPKAPATVKAPQAAKGHQAPVTVPKHEAPAPQQAATAEDVAPVEAPQPEPAIVPSAGRPQAPSQLPGQHTSREPRGGWKSTGDIIRNAPFPINP